jgi:hypothetical protein
MVRDYYPFQRRHCITFNVPLNQLSNHCRHNYPRDYFRYHE